MKVAIVSTPYGTPGSQSMRPLGQMALHAYLTAEFGSTVQVELFDLSDCSSFDFSLLDKFEISTYDAVVLCIYSTTVKIVIDWALEIKRQNKSCKIIVGGPHATANSEYLTMNHADAFDFIVRGEGELPLTGIIKALIEGIEPRISGVAYQRENKYVSFGFTDPPSNLNSLPPPFSRVNSPYSRTMTFWDKSEQKLRQAVALTSSRGCPFKCSFCSITASDSGWRSVSSARLAEWIYQVKALNNNKTEHVYFMDADFLVSRERAIEIGQIFEELFPEITWSFSARVDDLKRLSEPSLAVLSRQGLRFIEIGIESGSQDCLDRLNKHVTVQDNLDAVAMLQRLEIDLGLDFIFFLPDSTPENLRDNLTFLRNAGLTEYLPHDHFYTYLLLYPGTPLRAFYEKIFEAHFSSDLIPEPDELFTHPSTKKIFKYFIRDFYSYRFKLDKLIPTVDRAALESFNKNPDLAQHLRIEAISLRHIPYLVLDNLIDNYKESSLLKAVPWLTDFESYVAKLEDLCKQSSLIAV